MKKEIQKELEILEAFELLIEKKNNLNPYRVPDGYFILKKEKLVNLSNDAYEFVVPDNYFAELTDRVMDKVNDFEGSQIKSQAKPSSKSFTILWAAAAILMLFSIIILLNKGSENYSTENINSLYDELEPVDLAFLNDDAESYVLNALFEDIETNDESDILNPLFNEFEEYEELDDII